MGPESQATWPWVQRKKLGILSALLRLRAARAPPGRVWAPRSSERRCTVDMVRPGIQILTLVSGPWVTVQCSTTTEEGECGRAAPHSLCCPLIDFPWESLLPLHSLCPQRFFKTSSQLDLLGTWHSAHYRTACFKGRGFFWILFYFILLFFILSYLILSCLVLSWLGLAWLILSHLR